LNGALTYDSASSIHTNSCKQSSRTQLQQNFFSNRVVNLWNNLPEEVVMAQTVNCFKGRFDKCNADKRFSMEWWYKTDTSVPRDCHAMQISISIRQHVKIGQQASCLLYRMMMMMILELFYWLIEIEIAYKIWMSW